MPSKLLHHHSLMHSGHQYSVSIQVADVFVLIQAHFYRGLEAFLLLFIS